MASAVGSSTSMRAGASRRASGSRNSSTSFGRTQRSSMRKDSWTRRGRCWRATAPTGSATFTRAKGSLVSHAGSSTPQNNRLSMSEPPRPTPDRKREEVTQLLQRLVACDTSNPPGREAQAAAILEDYLGVAGIHCERVAKDPERPNLLATLRGRGGGPSLAFLGHLDVVQARRQDWTVEPFAGLERDGAIWGRGAVDMKCQVAATAVALATLAREGFVPNGDLMLILMADEEVGDAGVGAPFLMEAKPDLCPDYLIGEGTGERYDTPRGPLYLLDHGVKQTATATLTVRGRAGDASLADLGPDASLELARLLTRLDEYAPPPRIHPEVRPLIDFLAEDGLDDIERVDRARAASPPLSLVIGSLVTNVI